MAKSPKTFTSHSTPRAPTLSGPATRRRSTLELLQTRNRAFGPNGVPTTSRQTSATRTDTTSRLPISLGSTNKRYEPSTHLKPAAIKPALGLPVTDQLRQTLKNLLRRKKYSVPILYQIPAFGSLDDFSDFLRTISFGNSKSCQVRGSNPLA